MFDVNENVVFADNRVFIDVAKGCGFACDYCYCEESKMKQTPYDIKDIEIMCEYIVNSSQFVKGQNGTVISLCPHTEPLLTKETRMSILYLIKKIAPYGNIIQIASKAIIPEDFLREASSLVHKGQLVIFVSISSIFNAQKKEPFAPPLNDRLDNLIKCKKYNVSNCLYVKPFLISGEKEREALNAIVEEYNPDSICTGVVYSKEINKGVFSHPTNNNINSEGVNDEMNEFQDADIARVFLTSSCVLAHVNDIVNCVDIPKELCVRCNEECYQTKWGDVC